MKIHSRLYKIVRDAASSRISKMAQPLKCSLKAHSRIFASGIACIALAIPFAHVHADDFKNGLEAYQESKYTEAINSFNRSIELNESAAARHNLALSLYQKGQPAEAVWQLERAVRLDPLNENYLFKLSALRQQLGLYETPTGWWKNAANHLPESIGIWVGVLSFWIMLSAIALPRIAGFRRTSSLNLLIGLATIGLLLSFSLLILQYTQKISGVIASNEAVTLHHAPASAAPASGLARPGERAQIIDQHNDFIKINTEADITGWIEIDTFLEL